MRTASRASSPTTWTYSWTAGAARQVGNICMDQFMFAVDVNSARAYRPTAPRGVRRRGHATIGADGDERITADEMAGPAPHHQLRGGLRLWHAPAEDLHLGVRAEEGGPTHGRCMHIPGHEHQGPREVSLREIRDLMGNCQLCPLGQTRTNLVFGVGNPHARVMFIGEGPGRNEDLQGEPFVGAAGHKLDALLSYAGLTRKDVYIANVIKCRPPVKPQPPAGGDRGVLTLPARADSRASGLTSSSAWETFRRSLYCAPARASSSAARPPAPDRPLRGVPDVSPGCLPLPPGVGAAARSRT